MDIEIDREVEGVVERSCGYREKVREQFLAKRQKNLSIRLQNHQTFLMTQQSLPSLNLQETTNDIKLQDELLALDKKKSEMDQNKSWTSVMATM